MGEEYAGKKNRQEKKKALQAHAKNIGRVAKIDFTRKIISAPAQSATEGRGIMMQLLRLLGRTISKPVQSR